jgi:hypothetical protein
MRGDMTVFSVLASENWRNIRKTPLFIELKENEW